MTKGRPAAAAETAAVSPAEPAGVLDSQPAEQAASAFTTVIFGTVAGVLAAAGVALYFLRSKRPQAPTACGRCGAEMPESGSLCGACRREAAEEVRRASAERANQERAQDDFARRERDELELREQQARLEEAERLRQQELARQREAEEERLRQEQEEEARRRAAEAPAAVISEELTGPWALLGIAKGAGRDEIYAAYQQAKAKYDPDFVSHLGFDAQEHFRDKAQAIDDAYQQLMAALTSVA